MVSFALGSGFTIILAVSTLLLNIPDSSNAIDRWASNRVFKRSSRIDRKFAQNVTHRILLPILFSSSDSQLLTGFVVLLAGWIQVRKNLSVYHFSVIVNMAWSATNTQLLAFFSLRLLHERCNPSSRSTTLNLNRTTGESSFIPTSRYHKIPKRSRTSRAIIMVGHFAMLFAAATIQSHKQWNASFQCPVICVVKDLKPGGLPLGLTVLNYGLLLWGYGSAIFPFLLPSSTSGFTEGSAATKAPISDVPKSKASSYLLRVQISHLGKWITKVASAISLILDSMVFQIVLPCIWFVLGVLDVVGVRISGRIAFMRCGEDTQTEDRWGFGQLVPLLYLIAPVLPAIDALEQYRAMKLGGTGDEVEGSPGEGKTRRPNESLTQ